MKADLILRVYAILMKFVKVTQNGKNQASSTRNYNFEEAVKEIEPSSLILTKERKISTHVIEAFIIQFLF
jgi:hypothetical protein